MHNMDRMLVSGMIVAMCLISGLFAAGIAADTKAAPPDSATPSPRFDQLVRRDFFAGLAGDEARLARAMTLCEEVLARDPGHAEAMVWHGAGLLSLAGRAFQANDLQRGTELWERAFKDMDGAVQLAPDAIGVRIVRGGVLLMTARRVPSADQARALTATGVADYERVLEIQRPDFERLSVHARGELLAGPAEGWQRLGDAEKARNYLLRMARELAGTVYETKAQAWLGGDVTRANAGSLTCTSGCHRK